MGADKNVKKRKKKNTTELRAIYLYNITLQKKAENGKYITADTNQETPQLF